jgi:hypothetical protein
MARTFNVEILLQAVNKATAPIRTVKEQLKSLRETAVKTREAVGRIFIGAALGGSALLGAGLIASIKNASDLNETISKTNVVFGESTAFINSWAKNSVNSMGMSKLEALNTASGFGALFSAMGVGSATTAKYSTSLTQLAADIGSFSNVKAADVALALTSAMTGEAEPMKRFGVIINDTTLQMQALKMGMDIPKKGISGLDTASRAALTYQLILDKTTKAQGDFARTGDGQANLLKKLSANIQNVSTTIGSTFLPMTVNITKILSNFVNNVGVFVENNQGFFSSLSQTFSIVFGLMGRIFGAFSVMFGVNAGNIGSSFDGIVKSINNFLLSLKPIIDGIGNFIKTLREWMNANPKLIQTIGLTIGIVGGLILVINGLTAAITFVRTAFILMQAVLLANPFYVIMAAVVLLAVIIYQNFGSIKRFLANMLDFIVYGLTFTFGFVTTLFSNMWSYVVLYTKIGVTAGIDYIGRFVSGVGKFFVDMWNSVRTTFGNFITGTVTFALNLINAVKTAPEKIMKLFDNIGKFFIDEASKWVTLGGNLGQGILDGLLSIKDKIFDSIKSLASGAIDSFKKVLGIASPSKVFFQFGGFTGEGFEKGVLDRIPKVVTAIKGFGNKAIETGEDITDGQEKKVQKSFLVRGNKSTSITNNAGHTFHFSFPNITKSEDAEGFSREFKSLLQGAL